MDNYSLVPVDYQPDFGDVSLVPVDHDPFADEGVTQPAQAAQLVQDQAPQPQPVQPAPAQPTPVQPTQPQPEPQIQPQPESQPQRPVTGADQSDVGRSQGNERRSPGNDDVGGPNPASDQSGSSEPAPFNGYANPTPRESFINQQKMRDQEDLIDADRTGKKGDVTDGGPDKYKFVTTVPTYRYPIDGGAGAVFTATSPFYAFDGTRYAIIDASPERPVKVTARGDGTFTISRP